MGVIDSISYPKVNHRRKGIFTDIMRSSPFERMLKAVWKLPRDDGPSTRDHSPFFSDSFPEEADIDVGLECFSRMEAYTG
jgi:hypothetical protein